MADQKITELNNITGANLADADEFVVVDITADETMAITRAELKLGMGLDQDVSTTGTPTFAGLTVDGRSGFPVPLGAEIMWPATLTTIPTGWYDTTQRLLSGVMTRAILTNNPSAYYMIGGIVPALVLDFASEYYRTSGTDTTLGTATTHTGASLRTMTDSDGLLKWTPHNLLLNSATMSTQNITSLAVQYTLAFTGTGTVTLTGTSTAGPLVGTGASDLVSLDFTPTAGTLTLTVSGSVTLARVYRSDLGGMVDNPERADSYVPTTAAAVYMPRVGNHVYNGTSYVNEGLFLESEARTNLATYSEDFTDAWWTKSLTLSANAATSPSGAVDATLAYPTGSNQLLFRNGGLASGQCQSYYVKAAGFSWVAIGTNTNDDDRAYFNLSTGAVGTVGVNLTGANIEDVGNGWFRCSVVSTATSGGAAAMALWAVDGNAPFASTPSGTNGLYIYGAQLEVGATPSSYIPTAGSTVTRAAETLTVAAANMPTYTTAVSIQMDGLMTYADTGSGSEASFVRWYEDSSNSIALYLSTFSTRTGQYQTKQNYLNVPDYAQTGNDYYSPDINVPFNIASRHGSTFVNVAADGTALTANLTPTGLPDLSATDFQIGNTFMGNIGKVRVWADDIGDTGIAEAST